MSTEGSVLRAGVVGAGTGGFLSLRALQASGRYELFAVADLQPDALERAKGEFPGVELYASGGDMLEAADLDVVCVSTFATSHAQVVEQSIAAGVKGLLLEKPICDTWASGKTALDQLRKRNLPVVVPHGLLVRSGPKELLRRLRAGDVGSIEAIDIQCRGWDVMNAGIHWMDFALAALGKDKVEWVLCACDAHTQTFRDGLEVETEAVTYAGTGTGARIAMHTGDFVPTARPDKFLVFRLYGSEGSAEFWGWEDRFLLRTAEEPAGELFEVPSFEASPHQIYLEQLADMVASGQRDYELPELSLAALEICEAAYVSNRSRCAVRLPLASFVPPSQVSWDPGAPYRGTGGRNGRAL
jgi:predicted dehydrogenase